MGQFARYQQLGGETSTAPDFLSSHPNTPERIRRAVLSARQIGAPGIGLHGRDEYLRSLDGMLFGDDPLEGMCEGGSSCIKALAFPLVFQRDLFLKMLLKRFSPAINPAQPCGLMGRI